ncbi:2-dehydro-3-deoxygluconokinase [Streptomyces sp. AmelKG-E11A]|uniref:sugar kinase n=2 Tax=unclassified Streptomyces TaxID=2593676 RepID=UPI0008239A60|nr:sugar kinase [Streptomyces sp. AmelKG-E11A]SCK16034.1 2-dehydro-3-deoxygluconokinase [Streptomyces sp. AmelKG-E11A]
MTAPGAETPRATTEPAAPGTGTPVRHDDGGRPEVVTLGESMVTFLPTVPGPLADVPAFERGIGGAESNLACTLARAGHRVRWISRVGEDGFGTHLVRAIAACGVDTGGVRHDDRRPTGIYFRTAGERAVRKDERAAAEAAPLAEVVYYRAGSAASAMSPATMDVPALLAGRILHVSGITAALSAGCLALLREVTAPRAGRPLVSFDVNYRVSLWPDATEAGHVLRVLADASDLVFVGEDEAAVAWGVTGGPEAIRAALPGPALVVVKQGAHGAVALGADGSRDFVPALTVDVVAPVGAGDAFAAGFLSATLRALPVRDRLRHGHLMAAAALTVPGDLAVPPSRERADRLAALDDTAWGTLRLGPGWTDADPRAQEEVPTR